MFEELNKAKTENNVETDTQKPQNSQIEKTTPDLVFTFPFTDSEFPAVKPNHVTGRKIAIVSYLFQLK
jgi:hypothetical protein